MYAAANANILDIVPYKPGSSSVAGKSECVKLSSNENPYGPSPHAVEAYRLAAPTLALYPESSAKAMRESVAATYGLAADRIVCGAGSDELIAVLCQAYLTPVDTVVQSKYGFLMYAISAKRCGAATVYAEEKGRTADVEALLKAVRPSTRIVFLANPNNPTGTFLRKGQIRELLERLPETVMLALDNAYAEYVEDGEYDSCESLTDEFPNLVSLHTCSKIYGLASLRAGWAYGSEETVDVLHRARGPFNVSIPAMQAAAAAIADTAYTREMKRRNTEGRKFLERELDRLGIAYAPSEANFLLMELGKEKRADALDKSLQSRGIIIRNVAGYGLPSCLRATVGTPEQNAALVAGIEGFLRAEG
jgi:histidinol-phosphate aminotransferase